MARLLARRPAARLNGAARIELGCHAARYQGPLLGVGRHASAVWCLATASRPFAVLSDGRLQRGRAFAIPPSMTHEVRSPGPQRFLFWYVEPGVLDWPLGQDRVSPLDEAQRRWLEGAPGRRLLAETRVGRDPRLQRAVEFLQREPGASLAQLATAARLSPSRLRHLAVEGLGVRLARYRWWLRLRLAAGAALQGQSVTEAAHTAGFSDGAHFSRVFRRTFGFAPSTLFATLRAAP